MLDHLKFALLKRAMQFNSPIIIIDVISAVQTLAVADAGVPDGDWLRISDRDALQLLGEVAVCKHETWKTRSNDDTTVTRVSAVQSSVLRYIQMWTNHFCARKQYTNNITRKPSKSSNLCHI